MSFLDNESRERERDFTPNPGIGGGSGRADQRQTLTLPEGSAVDANALMQLAKQAVSHAQSSGLSAKRAAMARSYRAYNSQHEAKSKYNSHQYNSRAKNFVPKTKMVIDKNMVACGTALFSNDDTVSVTSENADDKRQQASAAIIKALLNIRLDRTNHRSGVQWFTKCMHARLDSQITGICIAKTYWEYEIDITEREEEVPVQDAMGMPIVIGGEPLRRVEMVEDEEVIRDRPFVDIIPPENAVPDMAAPDGDIVQGGMFWIVQYPMHVGDVRSMMKAGHQHMGGGAWRDIPELVIARAVAEYSNQSVRSSRERGYDRFDRQNLPRISDVDIVWVHENFVRKDGKDYHFWSLGTQHLLSDPKLTKEAYPAHRGERPYVMGVGQLEAHTALPTSIAETLRPIQEELNDIRNLASDTMRQSIAPIAKVRRGAQIDLRQVRERGPDATILLNNPDDVTFDRAPDSTGTAYIQQDRLAVEMDELGGAFSTSSVQSNHNLNETATGMRLMSGSSAGKTEFDLRVFVETFVEPVLRHLVWLEQFYETDENILAVAGEKAQIMQRYGINPQDDNLLDAQVTARVNVGIGAADPMQKLNKFQQAVSILSGMAQTGLFTGQVTAKAEEIFSEVFGQAGFNNADRFFTFKTPEEAQAEAAEQAAQQPNPEQGKLELEREKMQLSIQGDQQKMELERQKAELEAQIKQEENALKREELELRRQEIMGQLENMAVEREMRASDQVFQQDHALQQFEAGREDKGFERDMGERDFGIRHGEFERGGQHADRDFSLRAHEFDRGGVIGDRDFGLRQQEFERAGQSGERDFGLKMAGHNKTMMDERTAQMVDPASPAAPSALEQAMASIGMAIAQLAQTSQEMIQSQAQQNEMIVKLVANQTEQASRPKRVIRDEAGQVVGVETA